MLKESRRARVIAGAFAVLAVCLLFFWLVDRSRWQATDNAYVKADTVIVSPQIEGYVLRVAVDDNQAVEPGQVLVEIDPAPARARLAAAEASLKEAQASVRNASARSAVSQSMIAERSASVASAGAQAQLSDAEYRRYAELAKRGWVASQRLQSLEAQNAQAQAGVRQAQAAFVAQQREAGAASAERAQADASVEQARAMVEQARIDLDRTVIRAPSAGVVGARGVRVGQYVRPGANLLSIVPLGDAYVVANFKETQVARMRIGQRVLIKADAFGAKTIPGKIESFSPATGSEFALIPVENATGNFTKIVQRVPVKIAVDRSNPLGAALRPGLSIDVRVDLKSPGGASFAESAMRSANIVQGASGAGASQ